MVTTGGYGVRFFFSPCFERRLESCGDSFGSGHVSITEESFRKIVLSHDKEFICRGRTFAEKLAEESTEEGKEEYLLSKGKPVKTRGVKEKSGRGPNYVKLETSTFSCVKREFSCVKREFGLLNASLACNELGLLNVNLVCES